MRLRGQSLAISDCFLLTRVFLFAAIVPVLMRFKLARLAALLEPRREPLVVDPRRVQKISACIDKAVARGKPFVRPGCLTLGVARYYFLRRAGMDLTLHFGMGRVGEGKSFVGHCWLTRDGEPFLESTDPRPFYVEMCHISPGGGLSSVVTTAAHGR